MHATMHAAAVHLVKSRRTCLGAALLLCWQAVGVKGGVVGTASPTGRQILQGRIAGCTVRILW